MSPGRGHVAVLHKLTEERRKYCSAQLGIARRSSRDTIFSTRTLTSYTRVCLGRSDGRTLPAAGVSTAILSVLVLGCGVGFGLVQTTYNVSGGSRMFEDVSGRFRVGG